MFDDFGDLVPAVASDLLSLGIAGKLHVQNRRVAHLGVECDPLVIEGHANPHHVADDKILLDAPMGKAAGECRWPTHAHDQSLREPCDDCTNVNATELGTQHIARRLEAVARSQQELGDILGGTDRFVEQGVGDILNTRSVTAEPTQNVRLEELDLSGCARVHFAGSSHSRRLT